MAWRNWFRAVWLVMRLSGWRRVFEAQGLGPGVTVDCWKPPAKTTGFFFLEGAGLSR